MYSPKIFSLATLFAAGAFLFATTSADCCNGIDCASSVATGTWCDPTQNADDFDCCGVGACNIFCCNCDNGCLPAACPPDWSPVSKKRDVSPAVDDDKECIKTKFHILDAQVRKDNSISFEEFVAGWHLIKPGFNQTSWAKAQTYADAARKFMQFDTNGDGGLSLEECKQTRLWSRA